MPAAQSEPFKKAVEESRKLKQKPGQNELLELYSLFKQGTQDPPFEESTAPGMFDLQGKAKRSAWQKKVDEGLAPEDAQKQYVELVEKLKEQYGFDG